MRRKVWAVLAVGALVIAGTVWGMYPRPPKAAAKPANESYNYMYCPKCEKEAKYDANRVDEPCLYCDNRKGLIPTVESIKKTGAPTSQFTIIYIVVFAEVVALMAAVWLVARDAGLYTNQEPYYVMPCPSCRTRLRYRAASCDKLGACPPRQRACRFPFLAPILCTHEHQRATGLSGGPL